MYNTSVPEGSNHEYFMRRCIALAKLAKLRGDSAVGAAIVRNGVVIGEGVEGGKTFKDITFHAEIEAIRKASKFLGTQDLSDCTMYTTHEPCIMCSYVIRHSKLNAVFAGVTTGELGGCSSVFPLLTSSTTSKWSHPPLVIMGLLEEECKAL